MSFKLNAEDEEELAVWDSFTSELSLDCSAWLFVPIGAMFGQFWDDVVGTFDQVESLRPRLRSYLPRLEVDMGWWTGFEPTALFIMLSGILASFSGDGRFHWLRRRDCEQVVMARLAMSFWSGEKASIGSSTVAGLGRFCCAWAICCCNWSIWCLNLLIVRRVWSICCRLLTPQPPPLFCCCRICCLVTSCCRPDCICRSCCKSTSIGGGSCWFSNCGLISPAWTAIRSCCKIWCCAICCCTVLLVGSWLVPVAFVPPPLPVPVLPPAPAALVLVPLPPRPPTGPCEEFNAGCGWDCTWGCCCCCCWWWWFICIEACWDCCCCCCCICCCCCDCCCCCCCWFSLCISFCWRLAFWLLEFMVMPGCGRLELVLRERGRHWLDNWDWAFGNEVFCMEILGTKWPLSDWLSDISSLKPLDESTIPDNLRFVSPWNTSSLLSFLMVVAPCRKSAKKKKKKKKNKENCC